MYYRIEQENIRHKPIRHNALFRNCVQAESKEEATEQLRALKTQFM